MKDMTGEKYGRLTVLCFDHYDKKYNSYWKCKCECGNEKIVQRQNLIHGSVKSCGCLDDETRRKTSRGIINETGKRYGSLIVLQIDETKPKHPLHWICKCDCGNIISVRANSLRNGHTKSCGCIKSQMEFKVNKFLNDKNVNFKTQVQFDNLIYYSNLMFDFGIYDKNNNLICLIECQGEQHFKSYMEFGKLQREITDPMKKDYCIDNNIPLYYINYTDDPIIEIQRIYDNIVPSLDNEEGVTTIP